MKMRDVTVAVPEHAVGDFYLVVGAWLKGIPSDGAAGDDATGPSEARSEPAAPPREPVRRASRYDAIADLLRDRTDATVELSFDAVEEAIGGPLPESARRHRAWWSNSDSSQARAWLGTGYGVRGVDLEGGRVTLERR